VAQQKLDVLRQGMQTARKETFLQTVTALDAAAVEAGTGWLQAIVDDVQKNAEQVLDSDAE
jgi:hypothetical protein